MNTIPQPLPEPFDPAFIRFPGASPPVEPNNGTPGIDDPNNNQGTASGDSNLTDEPTILPISSGRIHHDPYLGLEEGYRGTDD